MITQHSISESTAALLDINPVECGSPADVADAVHQAMRALPFRTAVRYATEMEGSEYVDPGASELLALVQAAEALWVAQARMLDAIITVNMHLEGEGLPCIHIGNFISRFPIPRCL